MKKSERLRPLLSPPGTDPSDAPPYFDLYLRLFNQQAYYEAHDVLEVLWLQNRDCPLLKGLIQLAGAFVHLQKHAAAPTHPKHSSRLRPARALLQLALGGLSTSLSNPAPPAHLPRAHAGIARHASHLCTLWIHKLNVQTTNPWSPETCPSLPIPTHA